MSKIIKRENPSSHSPPPNKHRRRHHHHEHDYGDTSRPQPDRHSPQHQNGKTSNFPSYLERPDLPPYLTLLCEIIANTPPSNVEKALEDTHVKVSQKDVEEILKLSYNHASSVVKFFRWSGIQLNDNHSPYSWNLVVDFLGKNSLFDAMWDAIKSMRNKGLLSLATFASVFSSYAGADSVGEAFRAFGMMEKYGCRRDVVALNSLLSAVCRHGKTTKADEFLGGVRGDVRPDCDSFAILLEGWENEGNAESAKRTFKEMVDEIGWDPGNVPAYDSFLCTLLKGPNGLHEAMKVFTTLRERRCTPGFRFFSFALEECVRKKDARGASLLWEAMTMRNAVTRPDTRLYNLMIRLHSDLDNPDIAWRFLDEMVYDGAFPDFSSYDFLLRSLIKCRKVKDTVVIFGEMTKNEFHPRNSVCVAAVKMCLEMGDPCCAIKCWKFMVKYEREDVQNPNALHNAANMLIKGLIDHKMVEEAVKYAEDMMNRGVKLMSGTHAKLEERLTKAGKMSLYDEIKSLVHLNRSVS